MLVMAAMTVVRTFFFVANYLEAPFPFLVVASYLAEAFSCAVFPLIDVMVLALLGPDRRLEWGKTRVWGAIGWGSIAIVCGLLYDETTVQLMWALYPVSMTACLVVVARMPTATPAPHAHAEAASDASRDTEAGVGGVEGGGAPRGASKTAVADAESLTSLQRLRVLLSQRAVVLFLVVVTTMGMLMGVISNFLFVWLEDLGSPNWLVGATLTVTCLSEAPLLHYSGAIIKRFGVMMVLASALVCYAIRLQWYAHLASAYWVLPAELLHGVTYGIGWAGGTCYAAQIAPKGLEGTMQGLLSSAHWGVGAASGALIGGVMYENLGAVATFNLTGIIAVVGLLVCGLEWWFQGPHQCCSLNYQHVPTTSADVDDADVDPSVGSADSVPQEPHSDDDLSRGADEERLVQLVPVHRSITAIESSP